MSEALRLAEYWETRAKELQPWVDENDYVEFGYRPEGLKREQADQQRTAAELRRLHALVEEDSILLRRQRDEIAQLGQALTRAIARISELEAELAEQARLNGMGGEREASLMAVNAELVEALRVAVKLNGFREFNDHIPAMKAALAKAEASK